MLLCEHFMLDGEAKREAEHGALVVVVCCVSLFLAQNVNKTKNYGNLIN